jgi:hypothetical protein
MILLIGDSNLRNVMDGNKDRLAAAVGAEVIFKMATSTESIKTILDSVDQEPEIIMIHTPLNEVVKIVSKNQARGRDETLRSVIEEQNKIVHHSATVKPTVLHVLIPPFLRMDPPWMSTRIKLGYFYVKEYLTSESPWNIVISNVLDIAESDLDADKVHLNSTGKEKFYRQLETDILKCKANLGEGHPETQDWSSQMDVGYEPPTPLTMRKRPRSNSECSGENEGRGETGGKKLRLDAILDRLDSLVKEIKQERFETKGELSKLNGQVVENSTQITEINKDLATFKAAREAESNLTAEMKEDLDSLENENLKQTVIVRKLSATTPVPKDRRAIRAYIQTTARALVAKILDQDAAKQVKYAAPLYTFMDPSKKDNAVGLVPPFKVGFATKDMAIKFKETGVRKSKETGSEYKATYFTFFQAPGTRVRSTLLWAVADTLKVDGKDCWVTQNSAKPVLQIKEGGKIVETLAFVKAMMQYKNKISAKAKEEAKKLAKKHYSGNLERLFIAIKD